MSHEMSRGANFNQLIVDLGMENKVPFTTEEIVNSSPELQNNYRPSIVRRGLALVAIGATLAGFGYGNSNEKKSDVLPNVTNEQVDPNVDSEVALPVCNDSWAVRELDNTGHRVVGSGIESIGTAKTPEDAKNAAHDFMQITKSDPDAIKANAKAFLGQDIDKDSLSKDGCMTAEAQLIVNQIDGTLDESEITPDNAPANGINSGVNAKGEVVASKNAGISGNRKAIKIVQKNGTVTWILERCGNFVKKVKHIFKPGPTDNENPELPPSTTTYVPTTTSTTSTPSTTRWESTTTIKGTTTTIKGATTTVVSTSTSHPKVTIPGKNDKSRAPGTDIPADQDNGISDRYGEGEAGQDRDGKGYIPTETRPTAPITTRIAEQAPTTTGRPPATTAKPPVVTNPPVTATTPATTDKPQSKPRPVQP